MMNLFTTTSANTTTTNTTITNTTITNTTTNRKNTSMHKPKTTGKYQARKHAYLFKIGKLRFGFHGILGSTCLLTAMLAIVFPNNPYLVAFATLSNETLATHAYSLMKQVPKKTVIWGPDRIVVCHKEAFQLAIALFHYSTIRIIGLLLKDCGLCGDLPTASNIMGDSPSLMSFLNAIQLNTTIPAILFSLQLMTWKQFIPSDLRNGNSWIFNIPMLAAVTLDMCFPECLTMQHLVIVQFMGLINSFLFTLAFRGIISLFRLYVGSAVAVAALLLYGCGMLMQMSMAASTTMDMPIGNETIVNETIVNETIVDTNTTITSTAMMIINMMLKNATGETADAHFVGAHGLMSQSMM